MRIAATILGLAVLLALGLPHDALASSLNETKKLAPPSGDAGNSFGESVDLAGDYVIVGASDDNEAGTNVGAAYIFARDEGGASNWGLVKKLLPPNATSAEEFGASVAVDGDTAIVGDWLRTSPTGFRWEGAAYVFQRNVGGPDNWGFVKELTASDEAKDNNLGWRVALQGDLAVISAFTCCAGAGAAYVFERDLGGAGNWGEAKKIVGSDTVDFDQFGSSVDVDIDTVVVGAHNADDPAWGDAGEVYVFQQDQGGLDNWGEVAKLVPSPLPGVKHLGRDVALSGDVLIAGAEGVAFAHERDAGGADNWGETHEFVNPDPSFFALGGLSGSSALLISGDLGVLVYQRAPGEGGSWQDVNAVLQPSGTSPTSYRTAISGDTAVLSVTEAAWIFSDFKGAVGGVASLPPVVQTSQRSTTALWLILPALAFAAAAALAFAFVRRSRAA